MNHSVDGSNSARGGGAQNKIDTDTEAQQSASAGLDLVALKN